MEEQRLGQGGAEARESPGAGERSALRVQQLGAGHRRPGIGAQRIEQGHGGSVEDLRVLVQEQAEAALRLAKQQGVVLRQPGPPLPGDHPDLAESLRDRATEPSSDALSSTRISWSIPAGWVRRIDSRQLSRSSRPLVFTTQ